MICMRFCMLDTIYYAAFNKLESKLPDTPHCMHPITLWSTHLIAHDYPLPACSTNVLKLSLKTLPSTLLTMFPGKLLGMCSKLPLTALDGTLLACLSVLSEAHSQHAHKYTLENALKYTPDWVQLHTPHGLDCLLATMLSHTLWIALNYKLPACMTIHSQLCCQESKHSQSHFTIWSQVCSYLLNADCRCLVLGGIWQRDNFGLWLAGGEWHGACGSCQVVCGSSLVNSWCRLVLQSQP